MKIRGLKGGNAYDGTRIDPGVVVDVPDKVAKAAIEIGIAEKAAEPRSREVKPSGSQLPSR